MEIPVGEIVRVRIHLKNAGIALEAPSRTSFQNIFPGMVEEVIDSWEK